MAFLRKIFILQLVELVLTYNFTNCDFKKIGEDFRNTIYHNLKSHSNARQLSNCHSLSACLRRIEHQTFRLTGCSPPHVDILVSRTNVTFALRCPGYDGNRIMKAQETKQREAESNCEKQFSELLQWWKRFNRLL